jgi:hypothetical protein
MRVIKLRRFEVQALIYDLAPLAINERPKIDMSVDGATYLTLSKRQNFGTGTAPLCGSIQI